MIRELLAAAALPVDDLDTSPLQFWVWRDGSSVVGAVGLERYGADALVRSLVVAPDHRKQGIGEALVVRLEQNARAAGVERLVLLTQTAERFFAGRGYEVTARALLPRAIQESAEFKSLCPASAICMTKTLDQAGAARVTDRVYNVLFLCTGNSARSILAEAILNYKSKGRFHAFSAGSQPAGQVNPTAIELLERLQIPTAGLRSKAWDEFAEPGAPPLDFVITVCDKAAGEVCPVWPGQPMTAHWGVSDPAHIEGALEKAQAFREAFRVLERRIDLFTNLPLSSIGRMALQHTIHEIGRVTH